MAHAISIEAHLPLDLTEILHEDLPQVFDAGRWADGEGFVPACEDEGRGGEDADGLGHGWICNRFPSTRHSREGGNPATYLDLVAKKLGPGLRRGDVEWEVCYAPPMNITFETVQETDGRWIAEVPELAGVLTYRATELEAVVKAEALALHVLPERIAHGGGRSMDVRIVAAAAA